MRIAVIADIHGNYPAFISVIENAKLNNVDKFIFAGDYIFDQPFSNEVVHLMMKLENAHIIKGNKEGYLSSLTNETQDKQMSKQFGSMYQTYKELLPDVFDFLVNLDDECHIKLNSGISIYTSHYPYNIISGYSPQLVLFKSSNFHSRMIETPFTHEQYLEDFNTAVNDVNIKSKLEKIDEDVIIFAHNHLQAYGYCGDKLIINPGSCGQSLDFNTDAAYTILEITDNGFNVIEKRVKYDIEYAVNQIKKSMLYEKGRVYSEIVILAITTGKDNLEILFDIAQKLALSKNEPQRGYFSDSTWEEAYEIFIKR